MLDRRQFIASAAVTAALASPFAALAKTRPTARVYRSPGCSCCLGWARHLIRAGFAVTVESAEDIVAHKKRGGVPEALYSCHTAFVAGYVIEGHVPAREIRRLLREKPVAKGLAVPGMPVGSPGMEMGSRVDKYQVILFGTAGRRVYATYGDA